MQNPATLYKLLFTASADTIKELAADPKHLGVLPGFTSILHAWGQTLSFHPHIHKVVTGGGMTAEDRWKSSSKKFFLPVKVISKLFRGKFLAALRQLFDAGVITCRDTDGSVLTSQSYSQIIASCYEKDWCVYCKKPFTGTSGVFSYLGRYTHRVAISNDRIRSVEDGITRFSWRDYADGNKIKEMERSNLEFIRRFLLHVLPHGFTRIRHYGLYASRNKSTRLEICRRAIGSRKYTKPEESSLELICRLLGRDVSLCP